MMAGFFLSFATTVTAGVLPVLGIVYSRREYRSRAFVYVPVGVTFQLITIGIVAALLHRPLEYGPIKFLLVLFVSTLFVAFLLEKIHRGTFRLTETVHNHRALAILFLLAFAGVLDSLLVAGLEGYHSGEIYFRPPFNSDAQRNVFLINALVRHDGSPFLPGSTILYQLLWYHFGALFVSLFNAETNYGLVSGVAAATSYFFFFIILWAIYSIRPALLWRYSLAVPLLIIAFSHADVFYFLKGLYVAGQPCIVADGSCDSIIGSERIYESFSLKHAALISPQHMFFAVALVTYLGGVQYRPFHPMSQLLIKHGTGNSLWQSRGRVLAPIFGRTLLVMMFLVSPILSALVLPFFVLYEILVYVRWRQWGETIRYLLLLAGLLVVAVIIYRIAFDESAIRLFQRPYVTGVESGRILKSFIEDWTRIPAIFLTPVALVGVLGVLGILVVALMVDALRRKALSIFMAPAVFVLFLAAYYTNFVLGHAEVRRHVSIVLPAIGIIAVAHLLAISNWRSTLYRVGLSLLAATAMLLHGYYLYSFTFKPSIVSSAIPWRDYFCINGIILDKYRNWPTLAAIGGGLRFPLVLESTSSYARHDDATTHSRLRDDTSRIIHLNQNGVHVTELAGNLGIRLVVWGPVEDQAWGPQVKEAIVGERRALERCGSVGLYSVDVAPYTADLN